MDWLCLPTVLPQSSISAITSKSDLWPHRWNNNNSHSRMLRETAEKWIVVCRLGLVACQQLLIAVSDQPGEKYCTQVTCFYSLVLDRSEGCHQDFPCGPEPTPYTPADMGSTGVGRWLFSSSSGIHHDRWWPLVSYRTCLAVGSWPHFTIYAEFLVQYLLINLGRIVTKFSSLLVEFNLSIV